MHRTASRSILHILVGAFSIVVFILRRDLIFLHSLRRPLHVRMDPLPGNLRLVDRIEKLRRLRGLIGELRVTCQECGKCRHIP